MAFLNLNFLTTYEEKNQYTQTYLPSVAASMTGNKAFKAAVFSRCSSISIKVKMRKAEVLNLCLEVPIRGEAILDGID